MHVYSYMVFHEDIENTYIIIYSNIIVAGVHASIGRA